MDTRILAAAIALICAVTLSAQQPPDRAKAPKPGAAPTLTLPALQKRALANGLPVWIVETHEVPVVDVTLLVKAGASADPIGKFGLASFTAAMLDDGAGTRGSLEIADAVDFLGASLATGSSFDSSTVRLHTPVGKLDDALPIMADVALRPTFKDTELERLRKERLTTLLQAKDSASSLAGAAFARVLYGPRHRYGTPSIGNDASIGEMTAAEMRQFHGQFYQPANAYLIVVGDVTAANVMPRLEKAFGQWKNTGPIPKVNVPAAPQHAARQIYLVDKPGAPQSQIRIGWIGVGRVTPDEYILDVLNTILGGSFTSRLNQNLREEHGYAYGASSNFDRRATAGPFSAAAGVQTDKTVESLREFFKELDGMHQPIPDAEAARAKNYEALRYPGSFETTSGIASNLADLALYNLPDTKFNEYVPKIQSVTTAELAKAAATYLQTDKFAVVVVGDLSKIEKPIRDANFGPVKVMTVDEIVK